MAWDLHRAAAAVEHTTATPRSLQAQPVHLKVPGVPAHLVFSIATPSPNPAVNTNSEALAEAPAGSSRTPAATRFFFSVAGQPTGASRGPQDTQGQGVIPTPALYQADDTGQCREIHTLALGTVLGLFFVAAAQQVVCLGSDSALTTLAEDGEGSGTWKVLTTMRFSQPSAHGGSSSGGDRPLLFCWTGTGCTLSLCGAAWPDCVEGLPCTCMHHVLAPEGSQSGQHHPLLAPTCAGAGCNRQSVVQHGA